MAARSSTSVVAARELRVVVGRLIRRLREMSGDAELSPSQASVLSRLAKSGPATASQLAELEDVRPQSMTVTVAGLEDLGLLRRDADPSDGRRWVLSLTAAGQARFDGTRAAKQEWLARQLATRFDEQERQAILHALDLLDRLNQP